MWVSCFPLNGRNGTMRLRENGSPPARDSLVAYINNIRQYQIKIRIFLRATMERGGDQQRKRLPIHDGASGSSSIMVAAFIKVIKQPNNNSREWAAAAEDREERLRGRKGKSERDKPGGEKRKATSKTEQKREMKHRRTAIQPDRPVAQPAHVYLALLLRFFEVLIDELSRLRGSPHDRVRNFLKIATITHQMYTDTGNDSLSEAVT